MILAEKQRSTVRERLAQELGSRIEGEVCFDRGARAAYSTDASNYRHVPIGVVLPKSTDDVENTLEVCREFEAPVLARGAGTSLCGQACNAAVVIDMSKYLNRVLEVDPDRRLARVEPGVVLDDLRSAAERHGLTFGPDPATHNRCTLGGMIGNNSCGVHSVMAGKTDANVERLDVVTYRGLRLTAGSTPEQQVEELSRESGPRGDIYRRLRYLRDHYEHEIRTRYPDIPRRVSGFDLPHLLSEREFNVARALVGTEGTCVTVLEATLCLVESPPARSLVVIGFDDVFKAADAVPQIMEHLPIGLEGIDGRLIDSLALRGMHSSAVKLLPPGRGWLLVEFGAATRSASDNLAIGLVGELNRGTQTQGARLCHQEEADKIWEVRESALGATAIVPGRFMRWPGWDSSAVSPARMGAYLRDLQRLMDSYDYDGAFYGHFGDGCLHVRYNFDLVSGPGIAKFRSFVSDAVDLVVSHGGSISGEHGDGQSYGEFLAKMYGPDLVRAFRDFKAIWDPDWKMNPGKVVDARPMDADLRLSQGHVLANPRTRFSFSADGGSFVNAALRCVGVGKCRRHDGGTMCPSYMTTRDEQHSTRGRARLLFEMLAGDPIRDGWRDDAVREALDLCLACKACKSECPTNVDMASYKAEFLSHYYARRIRPRAAYSMGLIHWWARLASHTPRLVNALSTWPVPSRIGKRIAGISPYRSLPRFASTTFRRTTSAGPQRQHTGRRVLLWTDTFNNHFHPETLHAAVEVLRHTGHAVIIPKPSLCCGRPLYDFGMLTLARHMLRRTLDALRADLQAGTPVLVLEPSCAAVFRDELLNLFPDDEDAKRLSQQTFLLSEFLNRYVPGDSWPRMGGSALVHVHCHQKAIMGVTEDERLMRMMDLDATVLDSGCCGMAGAFGFEEDHYDVSVQCGERALLPAVRAAREDVLIIADGFSCREQIRQLTGRDALHLADVIRLGLVESTNAAVARSLTGAK